MSKIKVLVVDDSPTMRQLVSQVLETDPDISVVGTAKSALQARELIKILNPDVMTLDVEMPDMDGLSFLEKVMKLRPMPVVMVSSSTAKGTDTAIAALALGALDCVPKPTSSDPNSFDGLPGKVKIASKAKRRVPVAEAVVQKPLMTSTYQPDGRVLVIGSSTGGVEALISILTAFPANCPPTIITQHMPPLFTRNLASRLDKMCAPEVLEATVGAPLKPGTVYIAPGGNLHLEIAGRTAFACALKTGGPVNGHCPSIDRLFSSAARALGPRAIGVLLTGMGRDGAQGLLDIRQAGGHTIAQDEASSIVYGMPKAAVELGAVDIQYPITRIGHALVEATANRI